MSERFAQLPSALRERAAAARLGGVPALLAHPRAGWFEGAGGAPGEEARAPVVLWMHGRTVFKELDPGRYLRWVRSGIAACALDLPGHGERFEPGRQGSDATLETAQQMADEIDGVVEALSREPYRALFDTGRMAIGGMSAGGMAALIRLTRPHPFRCAAVESTAGDFRLMRPFAQFYTRGGRDPEGALSERLNPATNLGGWRPIPLLALHSEADEWVPVGAIRSLVEALRAHHERAGADASMVELVTWPRTGAPHEHAGFGRVASEAKDIQLRFFERRLLSPAPGARG